MFHSYHLEFKPPSAISFTDSQDWTHCFCSTLAPNIYVLQFIFSDKHHIVLHTCSELNLHHFPFVFILRSSFRVAPHC